MSAWKGFNQPRREYQFNQFPGPLQNLTVLCIEWVPYQDDTHKSRSVKDFFALLPFKVHLKLIRSTPHIWLLSNFSFQTCKYKITQLYAALPLYLLFFCWLASWKVESLLPHCLCEFCRSRSLEKLNLSASLSLCLSASLLLFLLKSWIFIALYPLRVLLNSFFWKVEPLCFLPLCPFAFLLLSFLKSWIFMQRALNYVRSAGEVLLSTSSFLLNLRASGSAVFQLFEKELNNRNGTLLDVFRFSLLHALTCSMSPIWLYRI